MIFQCRDTMVCDVFKNIYNTYKSTVSLVHLIELDKLLSACSIPRRAVRSHSLVCSKNSLLIVGIGPIINKELELIFRYDQSDCTCVYS